MTNLEEVAPEDEPRAYRSKGYFPKVVVAAAGPAVHFVIAIVLMFGVLVFAGDYRHSKATTTIDLVQKGSPAAKAGLETGDDARRDRRRAHRQVGRPAAAAAEPRRRDGRVHRRVAMARRSTSR